MNYCFYQSLTSLLCILGYTFHILLEQLKERIKDERSSPIALS